MIKYLVQNPQKWVELELHRFITSFGTAYDKFIFESIEGMKSEKAFMLSLSPFNRESYSMLPLEYYNSDEDLLESVYLFCEKLLLKQTYNLVDSIRKDLPNIDIFESLENLKNGTDSLLESAILDSNDDIFELWQKELERKINGEIPILESEILSGVPMLPNELTIIGARTAMGKTALSLSVLLELADKGERVMFISAEMPVERIIDRLVSYKTGIPTKRVTLGRLSNVEIQSVLDAVSEIESNDNIVLHYATSIRHIKRIINNSDCNIVVVDYLQRLTPDTNADWRLQVSYMAKDFKNLSVLKKIPIIVLAQVGRSSTKNADKRPTLADLKESGSIEEEANNVIFIHRPSYYLSDELKQELSQDELEETELIIAKQRDGMLGVEKCRFVNGRFYKKADYGF